ncbi:MULTISPECIES: DUF3040 domain-containing protein [Streptomyces]|uniref:DUF3040 domain-containing protein n=1 Tax=Streptomyces ardesiacus TaxID=285564 RepID=A0ABW8H784_9ACTN|nr:MULTISPECIES: DUF3040 domain-containing protein [Streptomyces]NEB63792.1 DUF3040 domain-containing protein [Streptomyces diastaticus]KOT95552.1 hypothetical protein ADK87_26485 [Streptomyces sp. NRRL F-4711]KOX35532.1 hypothetical protein ADL07_07050 [Streptomyces sp. NRRL F-4707]KOX40629.1 hypothetical protein ADL09_32560 [Streptomyces sp. NRRL F-7442]MCL7364970.1 DUF3040 domain-containing protein [Streptomyces ardesiacus]
MSLSDDRRLTEIETRLHREDPEFVRSFTDGRPLRPREYRYHRAWLLLCLALGALATGVFMAHGLLIAAGLVFAGVAGELFDPHRRVRARRCPPSGS